MDRAQVCPDADLLAGQRAPDPQLPTDQLQIPAGRHQHLQLHRSPIARERRWVHIARYDQARLAWAALAGAEPRCWDGHGQRLMGPLVVVDLHPGIDRLLGLLQAGERPLGLEQLPPQGLVEPLHLPGGGWRADLGQAVTDPVVPQELFEQHLDPAWLGEAAGELHPVEFLMVVKEVGWGQAAGGTGGIVERSATPCLVRSSHPR